MTLESLGSRFHLRLKDRANAANILAAALLNKIKKDERQQTIVLGIPRGGVVADTISNKLSCKFDIVIPRKLGSPHNEEVAIGAVMEDGTTYLNEDIVRTLEVQKEHIEQEKAKQIQEIKRRTLLYCHSKDYELGDKKNIVLVDDGAATGATVIAAAKWVRRIINDNNPLNQKLRVAVPVAPKDTLSFYQQLSYLRPTPFLLFILAHSRACLGTFFMKGKL